MSSFRRDRPEKPPPVEVREVGTRPVPFLRAFDWVAVALRSFRERPLPASYTTEAVPTFDLFSSSRINEVQFEEVLGTLGLTEVLSAQVADNKYRLYLSMAYSHSDPVTQSLQAIRVVRAGALFPQIALEDPARDGLAPQNVIFTVRNFTVPPLGRAGAFAPALAVGARITLRSLFIDLDVGEAHSGIS